MHPGDHIERVDNRNGDGGESDRIEEGAPKRPSGHGICAGRPKPLARDTLQALPVTGLFA